MKTKVILLVILSIQVVNAFPQQKSGRVNNIVKEPGKSQYVETLLQKKEFVFHARRAIPSHGSSIDLTTNQNYVKFKPDFIDSYMPFFGRAYGGVGYGGSDSGLHFKGKPDDFTVEKNRKANYQVTVNVSESTDNFRLFLTVSSDGSASLSISSNNRESISYVGEIIAPEKE